MGGGYKKVLQVLIKVLFYSLIGILISGVILLPVASSYFTSQRVGGAVANKYSLIYYRSFISNILSLKKSNYYVSIGTQSLIFITLPIFINNRKKGDIPIIILLIILLLPLLFPKIGSIFVGFNYQNHRWSFVYPFIFAYISSLFFNNDYNIKKKDIFNIILFVFIFIASITFFEIPFNKYIEAQILLLLIWLLIILFKNEIKNKLGKIMNYNILTLILIVLGLSLTIYYTFDISCGNFINEFIERDKYSEINATSNNTIPDFERAINYIKTNDDSFYRISKSPNAFENISQIWKYNSINIYSPILPSEYVTMFLDLNDINYYSPLSVKEFDYRTKITTLLGNKYLISYDQRTIPYGYSKIKKYKSGTRIYENDYALPFGVLYTNYISEYDYNNLSELEKESILLKTTILNKKNQKTAKININNFLSIKNINYKIIDNNEIFSTNKSIKIDNSLKKSFQIKIDEINNSELYILFNNLKFKPYTKKEITNLLLKENPTPYDVISTKKQNKWYEYSSGFNLKVKYKNMINTHSKFDENYAYHVDRDNFLFNLGYYDKTSGTIDITLSSLGRYTFDDIKVYAVSMDDYAEDIEALRRSNFEVKDYGNGYLNGSVDAEEDGILQFSTIYRDGWTIYVDGKKVDKIRSNKYFLGTEITKGKHDIYLKYNTPYLKEGLFISITGILLFIVTIYFNKKRETEKS